MGHGCLHWAPSAGSGPASARLTWIYAKNCGLRSMVNPPVPAQRAAHQRRGLSHAPINWRTPSDVEQSRHLTFSIAHKRGMHERTRHHGCVCCQREDRPALGKRAGLARAFLGKLPGGSRGRQTHLSVVRATARSRAADRRAACRVSSISSGVGSGSTRTGQLISPMRRRRATMRLPAESQGGLICLSPSKLLRVVDRALPVTLGRPVLLVQRGSPEERCDSAQPVRSAAKLQDRHAASPGKGRGFPSSSIELADLTSMTCSHALAEAGEASDFVLQGHEQVLETFEAACVFRNATPGSPSTKKSTQ